MLTGGICLLLEKKYRKTHIRIQFHPCPEGISLSSGLASGELWEGFLGDTSGIVHIMDLKVRY